MGQARRRNMINPFWKDNILKPQRQTIDAPPQVQEAQDIKITDKTICFVGPAMDCCVDKVIKEYVPYFEKEGYQIVFTLQKGMEDIIKWTPRWVVLFRAGTNSDFAQELGMNNMLRIIKHLKQLGVRVVYYMDDFLVTANSNASIQIASDCDAILVATTELKDFFTKLTNFIVPVIHVPTHIYLEVFDFVKKLDYITSIPRYRVLMTSSGRVGAVLLHAMCEKANERWEEFKDVEWIINASGVAQMRTLINSFRNLHKTYIDWVSLEDYYRLCKSVNVIINPASKEDIAVLCPPMWHDAFLNSKSAVKYTMAGAARIPCISSPMRSYVEAIQEGETGYIVNTADEFLTKILYLKDNPDKARLMGEKARIAIEVNFDIAKRYPLYRDAIIGDYKEIDASIGILTAKSDGGPGAFAEVLRKYVPRITNNKYKVVDQDSPAVKLIISVAFLNHEIMRAAKKRDPSIKFTERADGLPFVSYLGDDTGQKPGEIQNVVMDVMLDNFKLSDQIIWQSEFCKKQWARYIDVESKPNKIIYNGVDLEIFNTTEHCMPFPGNKTKILISSWSIFPHKRADLAIEIAKKYPDIDFHFVGNYFSTDTAKTFQLFSQIPNATYYGPVKAPKQLANLYRGVDALLFTSEHEGCPNSVLEAAACGCPIIYNKKCSVVPEMFGEDLVFGFDNTEDLDYIFNTQLNDEELIQTIRIGLFNKIHEKYTAEIMVKNYYMELIK
jgi:glycosyltransferase involved in cell wall biosynthesis